MDYSMDGFHIDENGLVDFDIEEGNDMTFDEALDALVMAIEQLD